MAKISEELITIRDYMRYGVSKFSKAGLHYGAGANNAFDEVVYLIAELLDLPLDEIELFLDAKLTEAERDRITDVIDRRIKTRKPAPYLINKFYLNDMCFYIDERVNIPRPYLGQLLLTDLVNTNMFSVIKEPAKIGNVLDLCCGMSMLSILAAQIFPNAQVDAVDISADALEVAKTNVTDYEMEGRISLIEGDLFKPVEGRKYNLILSTPPYLTGEEISKMPPEYAHEPKRALEAGADGLKLVKRIINAASDYLLPGGVLLCEVGNARAVIEESYPHLNFVWFSPESPNVDVFAITYENLQL